MLNSMPACRRKVGERDWKGVICKWHLHFVSNFYYDFALFNKRSNCWFNFSCFLELNYSSTNSNLRVERYRFDRFIDINYVSIHPIHWQHAVEDIHIDSWADMDKSVCMNALFSETIKDRVIKFCDNTHVYCNDQTILF